MHKGKTFLPRRLLRRALQIRGVKSDPYECRLSQFLVRLVIVQQVRVSVHCEPCRRSGSAMMRTMPGLFRNVNDVALVGQEDRKRANLVFNLAFENKPELAGHFVKVSLVFRIIALWISSDNVCKCAIIHDEPLLLE